MRDGQISPAAAIAEAVGIVGTLIYIGMQDYYGIIYDVSYMTIILNIVVLALIFVGMTLLQIYPECVNGFSKQVCSGRVRILTVRMVRTVKLVFVLSLLFTGICDVMGVTVNKGFRVIVAAVIIAVCAFFEYRIIRLLRDGKNDRGK